MSTFTRTIVVRFAHCDTAGIMFYPQFFALVNEMVEDWFAAMGASFKALHTDARKGVPTVRFEAEFLRPCRLGDELRQTLRVTALGRTSCALHHEAFAGDALAAKAQHIITYVDLKTMTAEPWPDGLRTAMTRYVGA